MVATTDVKFFVHSNKNAPQIQNEFGSLLKVLDACLIDGIYVGAINSITLSGNIVTTTLAEPHKLLQFQVIKISGADQPEFNGEFRVLEIPNNTSFKFEIRELLNNFVSTGTITCSLSPLNWEKPFSSSHSSGIGGKAAYRSKTSQAANQPYLRVVDEIDPLWSSSYAKYAKVGIVEHMSRIDDLNGLQSPFDLSNPTKNWKAYKEGGVTINGWAVWAYALSQNENTSSNTLSQPPDGMREWFVLGSNEFIYVFPRFHIDSSLKNRLSPYFFGNVGVDSTVLLHSVINGSEITPWKNTLLTELNYISKNEGGSSILKIDGNLQNTKLTTYTAFYSLASAPSIRPCSGNSALFRPFFGDKVFSSNILVLTESGMPVGSFPSCEFLHTVLPYPHLTTFTDEDDMKIAVNCMAYEQGEVVFNLGSL
ncbi:hypothetical protein [Acinetobacter bereziniae]|uniref:hypothetical protein n=1 Tax=Acinetobacter bereziniae TaxID=106648 RepID=UPI00300869FC